MPAEQKLDLYKQHKAEYVAPKTPALVEVGPARYLAVAGTGEPGGEAFQAKVQAMYGMAFTIKMASKFAGRDYKVCPLEGLWWTGRKTPGVFDVPREALRWKLLIRVPDFIGETQRSEAIAALLAKGKAADVKDVKLETIQEGLCVQMLHVGPYGDEPATLGRMVELAEANGLELHGLHHEIYLSDPRRVPPERLRTILRHPVRARAT